MTRTLASFIWPAIAACATMQNASPSTLIPTRPAPPTNLQDTVLQLAIRAAISPDSSTDPRRVLLLTPPSVDPRRALPSLPGVTFVTLDRTGFQNLADRVGLITVWIVGTPHILRDSAEVPIWEQPIAPRDSARPGWGGGCTYVLTRTTYGWRVERGVQCIYEG